MNRPFGTYLAALMLLPQFALAAWSNRQVTDEFTDEITHIAFSEGMEAYCLNRRIGVGFRIGEQLETFPGGDLAASVRFDDGKIRSWWGWPSAD